MDITTIKKRFSMPIASPSYPKGPYEFLNREYMIITYLSDPDAIRAALPEPLEPDGSNQVLYEFIKMPDSVGFGDYEESGVVIPCTFQGEPVNFTAQMYLDCDPPIAGGREIWGFPKKDARPLMKVVHDTLTGTLDYGGQRVATGTMTFKHKNVIPTDTDKETMAKRLQKMQVNLKMIPGVTGKTFDVLQLIGYRLENIRLKSAHKGEARLHLIPHVNAPVADLPVRKVVSGLHFLADIVLPFGHVLHDYLKD